MNRLMFDFKDKIIVVTGGARGIGKCICKKFQEAGAIVLVIDLMENEYFVGDLADKNTLESFADKVIKDYGRVDCLVNNAAPKMCGIDNCSYEDFEYALKVGVTAPFYLSKLFAPYFSKGASIINISSSRDRMSQKQTESYTAAKGGIFRTYSCNGGKLFGKSAGEFYIARMDRQRLYRLRGRGCCPTACRQSGKSSRYCKYGALSCLTYGRIYNGGEYLHRRRYDETNDIP